MSEHCGSMTEEGNAVCVPGACSCSNEQNAEQPIQLSIPEKEAFSIKQLFLNLKKIIKEKSYVEENS
ncbi:MAG: hypothetical protein KF758_02635 [Anaerolineales bacterium]|nr:hypothetical protein [Anaerolineales bacterium]MBX3035785.1 hypothetical protein [Anaerolineales bacterium]